MGDLCESPEFSLCGCQWQLRVFPGGSLPEHAHFLSYYLASKSSSAVKASYKLVIVAQRASGQDEVFCSSGLRRFEAKGKQVDGWGRDKFVALDRLHSADHGLLVNDTVVFRVEVNVLCRLQYAAKPFVLDAFAASMHSMCAGPFVDVTLRCVGSLGTGSTQQDFPANKCVLAARSPVFHAMFTNGMQESNQRLVTLPDDPCAVRELVHFVYTDTCSHAYLDIDLVKQVLATAAKYQVAGLARVCECRLALALTPQTCVSLLALADSLCAAELRASALQLAARHLDELERDDEFALLDPALQQEVADARKSIGRRFRFSSAISKGAQYCSIC